MKLKIGSMIEEINRMNNEIYVNQKHNEKRISIDLINTSRTAQDVLDLIESSYTGTLSVVYDNDEEDTFTGYKIDNIRKEYSDSSVPQLTVEFVKLEELVESDIIK